MFQSFIIKTCFSKFHHMNQIQCKKKHVPGYSVGHGK